MATKNTNTSAIFNRFYSLNHKFREGAIVGVVLSEDYSEDNILADYSEDITNAIDKYDIRLIDVYSIEIIADGVYNFIVVRYDTSDDDDWEPRPSPRRRSPAGGCRRKRPWPACAPLPTCTSASAARPCSPRSARGPRADA